jgi:hypothetical protein
MNKIFKRSLEMLTEPNSKVLRMFFFMKEEKYEKILYYIEILGSNDAVGIFENGGMTGYDLEHLGYEGEYKNHVDRLMYEEAINDDFHEISEEEFMKLVEEKYPNWRNLPGD